MCAFCNNSFENLFKKEEDFGQDGEVDEDDEDEDEEDDGMYSCVFHCCGEVTAMSLKGHISNLEQTHIHTYEQLRVAIEPK